MNNSREDSEKKRIPRRVKRGLSLGAATLFAAGLLSGLALQQVSIGVLLFALGIVLFAARGYLDAGDKAVTGALIFVALVAVGIQIVVHFLGPQPPAIFYALVPYLFFRGRGYSNEQLNLRSSNRANDALLILVILLLESAIELSLVSSAIFGLDANQLLIGIPLSFLLNLFGTGFPIMIFIYAILLPRFLKLTGSVAATVVLGGVAYATIHFFEAWTAYDTVANGTLSVIFLMFQYFGPGMIKSVLTLRTGNAWVHLWAYHAIAPHVTVDTPNTVNVFKLG